MLLSPTLFCSRAPHHCIKRTCYVSERHTESGCICKQWHCPPPHQQLDVLGRAALHLVRDVVIVFVNLPQYLHIHVGL